MKKNNLNIAFFIILGLMCAASPKNSFAQSFPRDYNNYYTVEYDDSMQQTGADINFLDYENQRALGKVDKDSVNPHANTASAETKAQFETDQAKLKQQQDNNSEFWSHAKRIEGNDAMQAVKVEVGQCKAEALALAYELYKVKATKSFTTCFHIYLGSIYRSYYHAKASYVGAEAQRIYNDLKSGGNSINFIDLKCAKKWFEDMRKENLAKEYPASTINQLETKTDECIAKESKLLGWEDGTELWQYTGPDGKTMLFIRKGDGIVTVGGASGGCAPLPAKLAESKSCIFCPLFKTLFDTAQIISTKSYGSIGPSLSNVILIAMAIFIAFKVFNLVSSFTKQEAPKMITELLTQAGKVLFIWLLLHNSSFVYTYFIGPVLSAGLDFGTNILSNADQYSGYNCAVTTTGSKSGVFPPYLFVNLQCFIEKVQREIAMADSIGSTLMCVARNAGAKNYTIFTLPDFSMFFQGLIIFIMAWIVSFAFAFYLIDATARLSIIGVLMPFLVGCWTFEVTRSYTKKGWSMFMNTFFTFVFMGMVVAINMELIAQSLTGGKGGYDTIVAAINGDKITDLQELLDIGFAGFLVLIACCLFGFKLTGQATALADQLAKGGGGENIGSKIGGLAASGAKGLTSIFGKAGAKTAINAATGAAGGVTANIGKAVGSAGQALGSKRMASVGKKMESLGGNIAGMGVKESRAGALGSFIGRKLANTATAPVNYANRKINKHNAGKNEENKEENK